LGSVAALAPLTPGVLAHANSSSPPATQEYENREAAAQKFRNLFFSLGKNTYSTPDLESLLYFPTPEMLAAPDQIFPSANTFTALQNAYKHVTPSQTYTEGLRRGFQETEPPLEQLSANPPTVLVFPGMFVEFSASRPFEDVLKNNNSSAARKWRAITQKNSSNPLLWDHTFNLKKRRFMRERLETLIHVASIDNAQGEPLVNVVYLHPPRGSLESTGTSEAHTERALRRFHKFSELWKTPHSPIYLVGYSRGGFSLLQFLHESRLQRANFPWAKNIRAAVGIGATFQGSFFADEYFNHPQGFGLNVQTLVKLARDLEIPHHSAPMAERWALTQRNLGRWKKAAAILIENTKGDADADPGFLLENITADSMSAPYAMNVVKSILSIFHLPTILSNDEIENIKSFKLTAESIHSCFEDVSSQKIQNWWRTHSVPADVVYVSMLSTMFDKTREGETPHPLVFNPLSYAANSIDFATNRAGYYALTNSTGFALNDGAVTAPEASLSVAQTLTLNTNQTPFSVLPLAVLASHHWGSVMPHGILGTHSRPSPFPRTLLMLSLASFLADYVTPQQPQ
jgi:hypothetical protein